MNNRSILNHLDSFKADRLDLNDSQNLSYVENLDNVNIGEYIPDGVHRAVKKIEELDVGKIIDKNGNEADMFIPSSIYLLLTNFPEKPVTDMLSRKLAERIGEQIDTSQPLIANLKTLNVGRVMDKHNIELDIFSPAAIKNLIGQFGKKPVTEMLHKKLIERIKDQISLIDKIDHRYDCLRLAIQNAAKTSVTNIKDSPIYSKPSNTFIGEEKDCYIEIVNQDILIKPMIDNFNPLELEILQNILHGKLGIRSKDCKDFQINNNQIITSITLTNNSAQTLLNEIESEIYNKRSDFKLRS